MKKTILVLFLYFISFVCMLYSQTPINELRSGGIQIISDEQKKTKSSTLRSEPTYVVFWTDQVFSTPLRVFYNGNYVGNITKSYSSVPDCGAGGCVTVVVKGKNNTWYAETTDGHRWYSEKRTLSPGCNSIRLYSSKKNGQNTHTSPKSSNSNRPYSTNTYEHTAGEVAGSLVEGWEKVVQTGVGVPMDGVPFLSLDLGLSVFYGEYIRMNFATSGMAGLIIYGGIGKDWIFTNHINYEKMTWHVGLGTRLTLDANHFHLGVVFGENPLCYNYGLLCEFVYHRFFGYSQRFGFVLGAGIGIGNIKKNSPDFVWDVQVGFAVKLWQR